MTVEDFSNLRKFVISEFIFGCKARHLLPQYVNNLSARKIFLVTDPGICKAGWIDEITAILDEAHIDYVIYQDITPNPKDYEVMRGCEIYREQQCDLIVAIGGGSVIDCAKGIAIVATNNGHINEFEGVDKIQNPIPPLICIPTTAGTSADISQFAIITNSERKVKFAIISKSVIPDVSLIDPETTLSMDKELTIYTGLDAFVHATEALVSLAHSSITDVHACRALELIHENIYELVNNLDDIRLRENLMLASLHAGMAFSNASLGLVHAMAHSLGGYKDLAHGECNSILLPYVVDYNYESAPQAFCKMGQCIGIKQEFKSPGKHKEALLKELRSMLDYLGIEKGLAESALTNDDIKQLAYNAHNDPCIATNPKYPSQKDIEKLYGKTCEKKS